MPRYNHTKKNKGALPIPHVRPWLLICIIVASVLIVIAAATFLIKKMASDIPLVYGGPTQDELLSKRQLISKVTALQTTINSYDAQLSTLSQLQSENTALKAELGRTPAPSGILADVITLPNRSFYDTMVIDAGSAQGIKDDMVVYGFGSVALGDVTSVETDTATVTLYSQPNRQTSGTAVGSDVAVTLIGRGDGEYEVQLPRDVPFNVGDEVAAQSVYPATIATIEKVVTDPRDPFQELLAKAPVNLQALKWVIVR